jgi:hypothetical protein
MFTILRAKPPTVTHATLSWLVATGTISPHGICPPMVDAPNVACTAMVCLRIGPANGVDAVDRLGCEHLSPNYRRDSSMRQLIYQ